MSNSSIKCSAPGCPNIWIPGGKKSFFRFPKEPSRCYKWLRFCGLEDGFGTALDVKDSTRICMDHFDKTQYYTGQRTRLISTALPTIHNNETNVLPVLERIVPSSPSSPTTQEASTLSPVLTPKLNKLGTLRTYGRRTMDSGVLLSDLAIPPTDIDNPSSSSLLLSSPRSCLVQDGCSSGSRKSLFSTPPPASSTPTHTKGSQSNAALRSRIKRLEKKIQQLEKAERSTTVGIAQIIKVTKTLLPPTLHNILITQLKLSKTRVTGRRWSDTMKDFSLSLYYHGPRSYRFLKQVFNLPSVRTLRTYQSCLTLSPGYIKPVFETLKTMTDSSMSDTSEKVCALIIDELSIRENLEYDKKSDMIIGLADNGEERLPLKGNHCLMAMIKGLKRGWKQVIGYWICHGAVSASKLFHIIHSCIHELHSSGIIVKALICDQGANNQSLALRLGISSVSPFFESNGHKVHFIFDPPHLLKSIRNNLLKYDLMCNNNLVSWSHIRAIYEMNNDPLKIKLLPKISKAHVFPAMFTRMKVKFAAQVLSYSVHTAIHAYIAMNKLPSSAIHTANFIELMDKLFDTYNSTNFRKDNFKYRYVMSSDSVHLQFLSEVLVEINSWNFVNCKRQPACIEGWKISIQSLSNLFIELSSKYNIPKLRTRFLNQDSLENTFSVIRQQHGCNVNPSAQQVANGLKHLIMTSLSKLSPRTNCENDFGNQLHQLHSIIIPKTDVQYSASFTVTEEKMCNVGEETNSEAWNVEDINAIYYVAGYICSRFLQSHKCDKCEAVLVVTEKHERVLKENHQLFMYFKAFDESFGGLTVPQNCVLQQFKHWEYAFCKHFMDNIHCRNISVIMGQLIQKQICFSLCCDAKFQELLMLYIDMRLKWSVRFLNLTDKLGSDFQRKLRILSHNVM